MIEKFKVEYNSDAPFPYFRKGGVYEAYIPLDMPSGELYAIYIENDKEPGDYGFSAHLFKRINQK